MKTINPRTRLRKFLLFLPLMFLFLGGQVFAQQPVPFNSNNEAFSITVPLETVTAQAAIASVNATATEAGFQKVYFSKGVINQIKNQALDIAGIRFYNGIRPNQNTVSVIAVAVLNDRSELNIGESYFVSDGTGSGGTSSITKLALNIARESVQRVVDNPALKAYNVFFSSSQLDGIIGDNDGIHLFPSSRTFLDSSGQAVEAKTMMGVAADNSGQQSAEASSDFKRSLMPCPPDCGDPRYYLPQE